MKERNIPVEQMQTVAISAIKIWLEQLPDGNSVEEAGEPLHFTQSGTEFAERLLAQNPELFERLSKF